MKKITSIPYFETKFIFVSDHYNLHLKGSCIYNNYLCEFKTIEGDYNEEEDKWDDSFCEIYKLNFLERLKWRWTQWFFEACVGYHWSYNKKTNDTRGFYYRKPKCLYKFLCDMYYKVR